MIVCYLTKDLLFQSRVSSACAKLGVTVRSIGSVDEIVESGDAGGADMVIADLSLPGLDLAGLIDVVRSQIPEPPPVIVYGPHVHAERLQSARASGCTEVLTRGQFEKQLDRLLQKYLPG